MTTKIKPRRARRLSDRLWAFTDRIGLTAPDPYAEEPSNLDRVDQRELRGQAVGQR